MASLKAVEISVLTESDDPTNHAGLEKLSRLLFTPLAKSDALYSLVLVRCAEHNAGGLRVAYSALSMLQRLIQTLAEADPGTVECHECRKRNAALALALGQESPSSPVHPVPAAVPSASLAARSKLLQESGTLDPDSLLRWALLQSSLPHGHTVDPAPLTAKLAGNK